MFLEAVLVALPAALAIAFSPFPVIAVVVVLSGPDGRRKGLPFAAGWLVGLSAIAAAGVALVSGADQGDSSTFADWLRVVLGALLVALAVRTWSSRPRDGEVAPDPKWMASLDQASAGRAAGLGLLLAAANPKNLMLTAAAAASMVETGATGSTLVAATAVFVAVGSLTVVGAVATRLFAGDPGRAALERLRGFMVAHNAAITAAILLLLGGKVLIEGALALRS